MYTSWVVFFPDEVVHLHILRIHFIFCILGILLFPPKLAKCIPIISPSVYMQKLFQYLTIIYPQLWVCHRYNWREKERQHSKLETDDKHWHLPWKKKLLGLALQKTFGKCLESFKKIAKGDGKTFAQKTRSQ